MYFLHWACAFSAFATSWLSKPTHFFFQLFIATNPTLLTRFSCFMIDWPDKYHMWGTPKDHLLRQTWKTHNAREEIYKYISNVCCLNGCSLFYHISHKNKMRILLKNYRNKKKPGKCNMGIKRSCFGKKIPNS